MSTMFGKLLERVRLQRKFARERTVAELWHRNNLGPNSAGYKLAETKTINQAGQEITEYVLYKEIDRVTTIVSASVDFRTENGKKQ